MRGFKKMESRVGAVDDSLEENVKMRNLGLLPGLFAGLAMLVAPAVSSAQIGVSITVAPPALPVYVQPQCPVAGYLWTPGYWAYGPSGYYWVPGVWVMPPQVGLLWTPAYWGFAGGFYGFHPGYWGPHVGFYGGINYGFGYGGVGFVGGAWRGGAFAYNTAVMNVNRTVITNTYEERVAVNNVNHTSFNGPGGINARPSSQEQAFAREQHIQPTSNQISHEQAARADRGQLASVNHGRPTNMAMARPSSGGPVNHGVNGPPVSHGPTNSPAMNRPQGNAGQPQGNAGQPRAMEAGHANGSSNGGGPPANQKGNGAEHSAEHHAPPPTHSRPEGKEK
jgi:hypothetical protein